MARLTWVVCVCALGVLVAGTIGEEEKVQHGGHHDRHDPLDGEKEVDGERNKHRDHEAIVGSRKEAEEADEMSPEESKNFLEKLARNHDKNGDGYIDRAEFKAWILESFKRLDEEEALDRMKEEDKDSNGLTWKEYLLSQYEYTLKQLEEMKQKPDEEDNKNMLEMVEEDEQRFVAADLNKDGILDKSEYVAFYHPYDFEHMHKFEIERGIKDYDKNNDGVVTLEEYIGEVDDDETRETEETQFKEYDVDGNGKLEGAELKKWLVQDNEDSAEEEIKHLMETADENKDKKLSIKEILDHQEDFVSSQATDYGATLEKMRDEL